jgi:hypothetical protein
MTIEEIEKRIPIGSKVVRDLGLRPLELSGQFAKVIGYHLVYKQPALLLEWEDPEIQSEWGNSIIYNWDPSRFTLVHGPLVHGPAVQEPNHEGMVYNPLTDKWSWF